MRPLIALLTISLLLLVTGCNGQQTPTPQPTPTPKPSPSPEEPKERAARLEAAEQDFAYEHFPNSDREPARDAASQFVKTELPQWTLKGMSTELYESNVFWVDVDIENGKRKRVLSLIVKHFYPESGEPYWKAFPLDKSHASQLHDARDSETKRELEQYRNP